MQPEQRMFRPTGRFSTRGHFTAAEATGPPGAKAPAGWYLSLVIDANTVQGLDFGVSPTAASPTPYPRAGHLPHRPRVLARFLASPAGQPMRSELATHG